MLSESERWDIEAELGHYEHKQAACIEALKVVQRHRGWVSDESLQDLALLLDMTPDELDSVATFYNLIFRRPVGAHVTGSR
jgi:NADH-quinone oxidoreductase subunit E